VLEELLHFINYKVIDSSKIRIYDVNIPQGEISKKLILNGVLVEGINKKQHSLEDYFLTIINGGGISA
jgi:ABC-2 type transport system ATP-binding protein